MSEISVWYWPTLIFIALLGMWDLYSKIRAFEFSGFHFYLTAGILEGAPFFIGAVIFAFYPNAGIGLFFFMYILSRMAKGWERSQEQKVNQKEPSRWDEWQSKRSRQSFLSRLFL